MALIDTHIPQTAIERETDKAYLIHVESGITQFAKGQFVWVPKSQVQWIAVDIWHPTMHVPSWLARKLGL